MFRVMGGEGGGAFILETRRLLDAIFHCDQRPFESFPPIAPEHPHAIGKSPIPLPCHAGQPLATYPTKPLLVLYYSYLFLENLSILRYLSAIAIFLSKIVRI